MTRMIIVLFQLILLSSATGQTDVDRISRYVKQSQIRAHLEFLASDALQGRETGTDAIETAGAYLASYLRAHGIDTFDQMGDYRQVIPFKKITPPKASSMSINGKTLAFPTDFIILNGDERQMRSQTEFVNFGTEEELAQQDVRLKVLISRGGNGQSQNVADWIEEAAAKRKRAIDAGAVGLIELYQNASAPWRLVRSMGSRERLVFEEEDDRTHSIPHLWVGSSDTSVISSLLAGGQDVSFDLEELVQMASPSSNIVGWIPGTDPLLRDEYIVYTAHYDHVGIGRPDETGDRIYNGARDNAVGATAVMMLAQYLSNNPTRRSAVFVFFTAEEKGLLGSRYFVENAPVPLSSMKYCFNIDNGGYNDTSIVSVIGLTRTEAESEIFGACRDFGLEAIEDPAREQGLFDRSDNVNFARVGIPAPTFSLGFRSFDAEIFKYYHQPADEVQSLNMNYIERYVKAYILSAVKIANRDEAAFWNEGDKYYEAGVRLYKPE